QILDILFDLLEEEKRKTLLCKVDQDIAEILAQILDSKKEKPTKAVSQRKLIEEWKDLWGEWENIVDEVGNEEGQYIYQEHHWEEPEFASDDMFEDLDTVAAKMWPYLEKIHKLVEKDKIFEEALSEIEDGIDAYPEWMGANYDSCSAGTEVTRCLIYWNWLHSKSVEDFLKNIIKIENCFRYIELDAEGFVQAFLSIPENTQQEIYTYIADNKKKSAWRERINSAHSPWGKVYHEFSKIFQPEEYLEHCRELIHENWQYGLPLIQDCLKKDDYQSAEKIYEKTISGFIHPMNGKEWVVEETLLISALYGSSYKPEAKILELFKGWIEATKRLNLKDKEAVLKIQKAIYQSPYDWDKIAKVAKQIRNPFCIANLLDQWKNFILKRTSIDINQNESLKNCWIGWLLDAALDETKDSAWFSEQIKGWLDSLSKKAEEFTKQRLLISILTQDLLKISGLQKEYPCLWNAIHNPYRNQNADQIRMGWLQKMEGEKHFPALLESWKQNISKMVPDPAHSSAHYEYHATWLAASRELNPPVFQKILNEWKVAYKRRKNLWQDLKKIGIE
ncbi:MAG: hypothetical protein HUU50_22970, partial [Candidatus Brocadiae bacterium]|nr:hypothetical protein [Candidatus Brocadiia bacterium]